MNRETKKRTTKKFSKNEDDMLRHMVKLFGENSWDDVASSMPGRNARQCKDRCIYYLSPRINKSPWTPEDDQRLIKTCQELNWKWVKIAKKFIGRTDTQIKNRWNTLKKNKNIAEKGKNLISHNITDIPPEDDDQSEIISLTCDKFKQLFTQNQLQTYDPDFDILF